MFRKSLKIRFNYRNRLILTGKTPKDAVEKPVDSVEYFCAYLNHDNVLILEKLKITNFLMKNNGYTQKFFKKMFIFVTFVKLLKTVVDFGVFCVKTPNPAPKRVPETFLK